MKAKLTVRMDNAAFEDAPDLELARILRNLADRLEENGITLDPSEIYGAFDANGNRVGELKVTI